MQNFASIHFAAYAFPERLCRRPSVLDRRLRGWLQINLIPIRLRLDCDSTAVRFSFDDNSTALRPRCVTALSWAALRPETSRRRETATICPASVTLTFCPFDLESGVRVTCDVRYLCVNFSLPWPLCSRLRPDIRDRQTSDDRRQTASSLNAPA